MIYLVMITKRMFVLITGLLFFSFFAGAQDGGVAFNAYGGYLPIGKTKIKVSFDDVKLKIDYKTQWGVHLGFDNRLNNNAFGSYLVVALDFSRGKLDNYVVSGDAESFTTNPVPGDNLTDIDFNVLYGLAIPLGERFELPFQIGPGFSFLKGGQIHNLCFAPAAKVKLKGYITNNFGLYAGVNGRFHLGNKKIEDKSGLLTAFQWDLEVGMVISLGAVKNNQSRY